MRIEHEGHLGVFEHLNRELSTYRGKVLQEDFQRVASFRVFEDDTNWQTGATMVRRRCARLHVRVSFVPLCQVHPQPTC